MEAILGVLSLATMCWLVVGLISPNKAMFWAQKRTRLRVLGWFVIFSFIVGGAIQIFVPKPQTAQVEQPMATEGVKKAAEEKTEVVQQAEVNREKIAQQTEAGIAELASKTPEAPAAPNNEQVKATVRRVMIDLMAMDKAASDPSVTAQEILKAVGKGRAGLGDVYGAMKTAKTAADEGFSKFKDYTVPDDLPKDVLDKLVEAKQSFRYGAMLRSDIAKVFMEWLDTPKPSLANEIKEKSGKVTMAMIASVGSLLEAMKAAGYTDAEASAALAEVSGQKRAEAEKPKAKRKRN